MTARRQFKKNSFIAFSSLTNKGFSMESLVTLRSCRTCVPANHRSEIHDTVSPFSPQRAPEQARAVSFPDNHRSEQAMGRYLSLSGSNTLVSVASRGKFYFTRLSARWSDMRAVCSFGRSSALPGPHGCVAMILVRHTWVRRDDSRTTYEPLRIFVK